MLSSKDLKERTLRLSMIDTVRNSQIALPLVMLLEVYMIISWVVNVDDKTATSSLCYLVGYISLLLFSAIVLAFIHFASKCIDETYHRINRMQHLLAFVFLLWAVCFTYVGSEMRGHFDYLIFITFVTLLPLFCYLNPVFWTILQLAGSGCLYYMASHHDRFFPFLINFTVFTIISMAAGWTMRHIRYQAYKRQIELEQERNYAYDLAHRDSLTGLPSRQSFNEAIEQLKAEQNSQDVIILMCDVNGLKSVNDQFGHKAGDELLQGAALCLKKAFLSLGTIYRVGGDEFVGILYSSDRQLYDAIRLFEWITSKWGGKYSKHLSVSVGHASVRDNPDASFDALLTMADDAMYEAKRRYYEQKAKNQ